MGFNTNVMGLDGLYAKVGRVNIQNKMEVETVENEDGSVTTTELGTCPMAVIIHLYSDKNKTNKIDIREHHVSYNPEAEDKQPINQAYTQIKSLYEVVEDNV